MTKEKAIVTIMRWIGCSWKDAEKMFNGVHFWKDENYSAYLDEEDRLCIVRGGVLIHRIIVL
ncbi:MAG: hypothetical protein LUI61_06500 [Firmicutes bacterium]|nr:hypothetical protein [Bacillota bacterium]